MAEEEEKMESGKDKSEEQRRAWGIDDMNRAEGGRGRKNCSKGLRV